MAIIDKIRAFPWEGLGYLLMFVVGTLAVFLVIAIAITGCVYLVRLALGY